MSIQIETQGDILILRPMGRLDSANSPELENILKEHLDKGTQRLIFDFSSLDYISSAGLRVVLLGGKRIRSVSGKMALVGLRDATHDVFEMSGFLNLFPVVETIDEGIATV